ncbi:MAG: NAD(P)-dependent oxidoreductase [Candidatus Shapirobacteria bacterium]|jgi:phosphoglycerate dehydrogenase-like enzyme
MKIYLLSPVAQTIFSSDFIDQLKPFGEIIIDKDSKPVSQIKDITTNEEKIIALDPDFCSWKLDKTDLESIPNIKAICIQSTSFSWIDIAYCQSVNIPVINIRNYSTESVAQWAVMMALMVARKLPLVIKNNWIADFSLHPGLELKDKVVGIIGLGNIGKRIAEICQGFGMKVIYWSKNSVDSRFQKVELTELMSAADVIFPCLAQNSDTQDIITDNLIMTMKPVSIFISIVHKIYNHELLLTLVSDKKIYGYAFEESEGNFSKYDGNIFASPELAWCTSESLERNLKFWLENIKNAINNDFSNRVN